MDTLPYWLILSKGLEHLKEPLPLLLRDLRGDGDGVPQVQAENPHNAFSVDDVPAAGQIYLKTKFSMAAVNACTRSMVDRRMEPCVMPRTSS